jgi:DNA-binding LytR/AlgR family response regulator
MLKTVIIDDEPLAIDIIKNYCESVTEIELLGCFTDPVKAMHFVNNNAVDLLFLDIEMPLLNGLEFLDTLTLKPQVIFTTAYPQFAINGFELDALDYLIKPVSYKRFLKAVNKFKLPVAAVAPALPPQEAEQPLTANKNGDRFLFIKSDYESLKVFYDDIKLIEGFKDYLKVHLSNGKNILTLTNFKTFQEKLPEKVFIRVHNSYVVNLNYINSVQRNRIVIDALRIPISETYKKPFFERINIK